MAEIDRALLDRRMLGAGFDDMGTWRTWLTVLKAAFGQPLDEQELGTFAAVAGNRASPRQRVRELWCVAGRRSGKSRIAAAVAVYLALFVKHRLAKGERGMCLVIAGSVDQARMVFNYIRGFLEAAPALEREVAAVKRSEIELKNGIVIAVHSNSFRTVRGRTLVAAILDEVSFWRDETTATPDVEVYRAVLPSLATTDGMLIGISTPYRRLGLLHQKHRDHFGVDDDNVLVVQGASTVFNPSLSDAAIAAQRAADPTAAGAEWDAEFRSDIASFLDDELIDSAVEQGRPLELPPADGVRYSGFVDASGGGGADSYTIAISHKESDLCVLDVVRGTSGKFDPHQVTRQYGALCKEYRITSVTGDAYAREWVAATWRETGITYQQSELVKSEIYLETIPLFARGLVRLPDHARLLRELRALERHTHRSGKDSVDHPRNGRDDHANAACGALHMVGRAPIGLEAISLDAWTRILHDSANSSRIGNVRFWGQSGHRSDIPKCPLLTQSGHGRLRIAAVHSIAFQIFEFKLLLSFEGEWVHDMPLIGIRADAHDPRCSYCPYKKALVCSARSSSRAAPNLPSWVSQQDRRSFCCTAGPTTSTALPMSRQRRSERV